MQSRQSHQTQPQQSTRSLFQKKNYTQLASLVESARTLVDLLDSHPGTNQFAIKSATAASCLLCVQGYISVIDSFSSVGGGYCPSVHRLSDLNNEYILPFCITDYSSYPTTPAVAALESHG